MLYSSAFSKLRAIGVSLALGCATIATPTAAQSSDVNQLRAAIVFNVLRFIDFPGEQGGPIEFCVASDSGEGAALRSFSGRRAGSRTVSVRTVRAGAYSGCDAVYLDSGDRDQIQRAKARGRIVIGNGRNFIDNGGTVGLVQSGGQVRFQLNLGSASESQIAISSRLIRLASRVTR
jgi:hypothetical protein